MSEKNHTAIVFDFDGLLIDTEIIHIRSWEEFFRSIHVKAERSAFSQGVGKSDVDFAEILRRQFALDLSVGEIVRRKADLYRRMLAVEPLAPEPGVAELIDSCASVGFPIAVASSSVRFEVELGLRRMFEAMGKGTSTREVFRAVCCGDEVEKRKPAPDLYLLAAQRLELPPAACLALEDSPDGSRAALAAGMQCIAVGSEYTRGMEFPAGIREIDSVAEIASNPVAFRLPVPVREGPRAG